MTTQCVQLSSADREYLENLIGKSELSARTYQRALGLLELDRGQSYKVVSDSIHVSVSTLFSWVDRYRASGLQVLYDQHHAGRPVEIDAEQRAKIVALATSPPPTGHSRWSLRLLAQKAVELGYCVHVSHSEVKRTLNKTYKKSS